MIVTHQRTAAGWLLFLPLCPSTNARMIPTRRYGGLRLILSKPARTYIEAVSAQLARWARRVRFRPIGRHTQVEMWVILPRTSCDAHNYDKVLFDALERGGLFTNDRFIMPHLRGIDYDSKRPEIIVHIPHGGPDSEQDAPQSE